MSDVIDLNEKREKRKPKEKVKRVDIYRAIADVINHQSVNLPNFTDKFVVYQPEKGTRVIFQVTEDDVCEPVSDSYVVDILLKYLDTTAKTMRNEHYKLEMRYVKEAVTRWKNTAPLIEEPAAVLFRDQPGLTVRRLPWDFDPEGDSPKFDELFSRMENAEAARHFIGSIFVPDSYRQQYLYLHGQGLDGKGSLTTFLLRVMGNSGALLDMPGGSAHWSSILLNLRLGVFDDVNETDFVTSGQFKRLTGMDTVYINPKGKPSYNAPLATKFIITSNRLPSIKGQKSDIRRAIVCDMSPPKEEDLTPENMAAYHDALWEEGGPFLSRCIQAYQEAYPNPRAPILCSTDLIEGIAEEENARYQQLFRSIFSVEEGAELKAQDFADRLNATGLNNRQIGEFKIWMRNKYGIKFSQRRSAQGKINFYPGLKILREAVGISTPGTVPRDLPWLSH